MRPDQTVDERTVGLGKRELEQIGRENPAELLATDCLGTPGDTLREDETDSDRLLRVAMEQYTPESAGEDLDRELFRELAGQRLLGGLARLDLPAGEFPLAGEMGVGRPAGHENTPVLDEDTGDDLDRGIQITAPSGTA